MRIRTILLLALSAGCSESSSVSDAGGQRE
jgi:hypothetical protein